MHASALHGRLRDLSLDEVLQLLSLGRKTGALRVEAPVYGRRARIEFVQGLIRDARVWTVDEAEPIGDRSAAAQREVQHLVFEVLQWRDGQFRFEAANTPDSATAVTGSTPAHATAPALRLAVDPILVEAARRAEQWARIADRVPHPGVIPAFVETGATSLPLLRLSSPQWEVLTRVDGQRDLHALAAALQRDVMDVANGVHELLAAGVLTLRDVAAVPRRNPTPPAVMAVADPMRTPPVPPVITPLTAPLGPPTRGASVPPAAEAEEDTLFDPVAYGVRFEGGQVVTPPYWPSVASVASNPVTPSIAQEQESVTPPDWHGPALCRFGDDLARRGDLRGALVYWHAALRAMVPVADSERVRETIALVTRLLALLQS